jgi:hypothetical protein
MQNVVISPIVTTPAPLFAKIYCDMMHLPKSAGFRYLIQSHCSLIHWPEFDTLCKETAKALTDWLMCCFIWHWGTLSEIITDNGVPWLKALEYLSRRYHINHIRISGYNSHANGLVKRSHFNVCQAIFKGCNSDQAKWHPIVYSIFWAECITVHHCMGCSPYFTVTRTHLLLPLDIAEATYLLPPPNSILSTTNLIANRTIALQKCHEHLANLHNKVYEA